MGNPLGTAGGPMLNILTSKNITNILVIVTRYFGGILLGTGGLVRAYSLATEKALEKVNIINKDLGLEVKFEVTYSDFNKLQYYFNKNNVKILSSDFNENVIVIFEIQREFLENILKERKNLTFKILNQEIIKSKYIVV